MTIWGRVEKLSPLSLSKFPSLYVLNPLPQFPLKHITFPMPPIPTPLDYFLISTTTMPLTFMFYFKTRKQSFMLSCPYIS